MSTERLSFGFNSLIPETYKSKAEAFAKCLQHKLLSLGRIDSSSDSFGGESRIRLNNDREREQDGEYSRCAEKIVGNQQKAKCEESQKNEESDEEFCSHSESENSDFFEQRKNQKLVSMSSEDSTVESWSSCQENLTDFEKFDSESEEVNSFASQIKGSPKLRSYNIRTKRKELREKSWKRNSKRNHSSSTESVDSEGLKQNSTRQIETDPEVNSQYILFDGLEAEEEQVPHRILRESSSTSNLERHFSFREDPLDLAKEKEAKGEPPVGVDPDLLTPPPSPNMHRKTRNLQEVKHQSSPVDENSLNEAKDLNDRLQYANQETDFEEVEFDEVEYLKDFSVDGISRTGKKVGAVVVECSSDGFGTDFELPSECGAFVVTCVDVLQHKPEEEEEENAQSEPNCREEPEILLKDSEERESEMTEDEILNSRSKMRRCSSLKTWKTPPGTPGAKKIVRFADALGLDLADVRTFLDEIPKVPSSAYEDLHFDLPKTEQLPPLAPTPTLIPLFQQPGNAMDFLEKVQHQKVCLESAIVTDTGFLTVTGFIRVQNMSFHKSVHVRYSLNNWETFADLQATYVPNSCDGFSDKFSFVLFGHTLKIGQKLEFALRLECSGTQYWDNNGGINYVFNCLPQTSANSFFSTLSSSKIDPWLDFY